MANARRRSVNSLGKRKSFHSSWLWTPMGNNIWKFISGVCIRLKDIRIDQIFDFELPILQEVALKKLQEWDLCRDLAFQRNIKNPSVLKLTKTGSKNFADMFSKHRSSSIFSALPDRIFKKKNKSLVFGIPIAKAIENDQLLHDTRRLSVKTELINEIPEATTWPRNRDSKGRHSSVFKLSPLKYAVNPNIPVFVNNCLKYLEEKSLNVQGIFRVSCSKKRMTQLKLDFDTGKKVNLEDNPSPHDVAGLLKEYFRELPEPLMTNELHQPFLATRSFENDESRIKILNYLLCLLPETNRNTLQALLMFLYKITQYAPDKVNEKGETVYGNKMDARNLSLIFGPNILHTYRLKKLDLSQYNEEMMEERRDAIKVIQFMIENAKKLFKVDADLLDQLYLYFYKYDPEMLEYSFQQRYRSFIKAEEERLFIDADDEAEDLKPPRYKQTRPRPSWEFPNLGQLFSGRRETAAHHNNRGSDINPRKSEETPNQSSKAYKSLMNLAQDTILPKVPLRNGKSSLPLNKGRGRKSLPFIQTNSVKPSNETLTPTANTNVDFTLKKDINLPVSSLTPYGSPIGQPTKPGGQVVTGAAARRTDINRQRHTEPSLGTIHVPIVTSATGLLFESKSNNKLECSSLMDTTTTTDDYEIASAVTVPTMFNRGLHNARFRDGNYPTWVKSLHNGRRYLNPHETAVLEDDKDDVDLESESEKNYEILPSALTKCYYYDRGRMALPLKGGDQLIRGDAETSDEHAESPIDDGQESAYSSYGNILSEEPTIHNVRYLKTRIPDGRYYFRKRFITPVKHLSKDSSFSKVIDEPSSQQQVRTDTSASHRINLDDVKHCQNCGGSVMSSISKSLTQSRPIPDYSKPTSFTDGNRTIDVYYPGTNSKPLIVTRGVDIIDNKPRLTQTHLFDSEKALLLTASQTLGQPSLSMNNNNTYKPPITKSAQRSSIQTSSYSSMMKNASQPLTEPYLESSSTVTHPLNMAQDIYARHRKTLADEEFDNILSKVQNKLNKLKSDAIMQSHHDQDDQHIEGNKAYGATQGTLPNMRYLKLPTTSKYLRHPSLVAGPSSGLSPSASPSSNLSSSTGLSQGYESGGGISSSGRDFKLKFDARVGVGSNINCRIGDTSPSTRSQTISFVPKTQRTFVENEPLFQYDGVDRNANSTFNLSQIPALTEDVEDVPKIYISGPSASSSRMSPISARVPLTKSYTADPLLLKQDSTVNSNIVSMPEINVHFKPNTLLAIKENLVEAKSIPQIETTNPRPGKSSFLPVNMPSKKTFKQGILNVHKAWVSKPKQVYQIGSFYNEHFPPPPSDNPVEPSLQDSTVSTEASNKPVSMAGFRNQSSNLLNNNGKVQKRKSLKRRNSSLFQAPNDFGQISSPQTLDEQSCSNVQLKSSRQSLISSSLAKSLDSPLAYSVTSTSQGSTPSTKVQLKFTKKETTV